MKKIIDFYIILIKLFSIGNSSSSQHCTNMPLKRVTINTQRKMVLKAHLYSIHKNKAILTKKKKTNFHLKRLFSGFM